MLILAEGTGEEGEEELSVGEVERPRRDERDVVVVVFQNHCQPQQLLCRDTHKGITSLLCYSMRLEQQKPWEPSHIVWLLYTMEIHKMLTSGCPVKPSFSWSSKKEETESQVSSVSDRTDLER